jgi:hypothetical protein
MKTTSLISFLAFICHLTVHAQAVYVDSNTGDDKNPGTKESPVYSIHKATEIVRSQDNDIYDIKINPGIYILDSHVSVATEKEMIDKRIIIEASILPDDTSWTPEKMPVIASKAKKGQISLRLTGNDDKPPLDGVDKPLPIDYLHIIPGSLGYDMGAGLFKNRKQ